MEKLRITDRFDEGGDIILDIRVQPGGMAAAQQQLDALKVYGEEQNIIVKVEEFP